MVKASLSLSAASLPHRFRVRSEKVPRTFPAFEFLGRG
ncbi:hypothetical protein STRDD11_01416 [Streptococcus sp. DD11]|nr:hypothetical protein STRDD11_01416 [Streptococcus sp. DD11]